MHNKELVELAYSVLVDGWGVDGDHDLSSVADALQAGDREQSVRKLEAQIEFISARLRAYLTLRHALVMSDAATLESIRDKDPSNIDDWPDRMEA